MPWRCSAPRPALDQHPACRAQRGLHGTEVRRLGASVGGGGEACELRDGPRYNDRLVVGTLAALGARQAALVAAARLVRDRGLFDAEVLFEPHLAAARGSRLMHAWSMTSASPLTGAGRGRRQTSAATRSRRNSAIWPEGGSMKRSWLLLGPFVVACGQDSEDRSGAPRPPMTSPLQRRSANRLPSFSRRRTEQLDRMILAGHAPRRPPPRSWRRAMPDGQGQRGSDVTGDGGEGGIRTHGAVARTPHFECGAFDHSATSPHVGRRAGYAGNWSDARL